MSLHLVLTPAEMRRRELRTLEWLDAVEAAARAELARIEAERHRTLRRLNTLERPR